MRNTRKNRWLSMRSMALNTPSPSLQQPVSARPLTQPQPYGVMPGEYVDPPYVDPFDVDDLLDALETPMDSLRFPATRPEGSANSAGKLLPIFDPAYNLREAAKQMLLLEDHLNQPDKRCSDCIRKHLLTAEALAEEAVSLDKEYEYRQWTQVLPEQYRSWMGALESDSSPAMKQQVAGQIRQTRKKLVSSLANTRSGLHARRGQVRMGSSSAPPRSPAAATRQRLSFVRSRQATLGDVASAPSSVDVRLESGEVWRVRANGTLEQLAGPLEGDVITKARDGAMYDSVVQDLAKVDPTVLRVLGMSSAPASQSFPFIAGASGGDKVVFADRSSSSREITGWKRGELAKVGEDVAGHKVTSIPQDGWVAVYTKSEGKWFGQWVKADETVALNKGKLASSVLRGKKFPLFLDTGEERGRKLNEGELAMADLIQSVLSKTLVEGRLPKPLTQANGVRVLENVIAAAIVNAGYESFFDPSAVGDSGKSVGLFQLHESGAGSGMTVAQRKNPIANTVRISDEFFREANKPGTTTHNLVIQASQGKVASVADWTYAWTVDVEKPYAKERKGRNRAKTAVDLFSSPRLSPTGVVPTFAPMPVRPMETLVSSADHKWLIGGVAIGALALGMALASNERSSGLRFA